MWRCSTKTLILFIIISFNFDSFRIQILELIHIVEIVIELMARQEWDIIMKRIVQISLLITVFKFKDKGLVILGSYRVWKDARPYIAVVHICIVIYFVIQTVLFLDHFSLASLAS